MRVSVCQGWTTILRRHAGRVRHAAPKSLIDLTPDSVCHMITTSTASPDRREGTSISKYQDVEVGHWFRTPDGTYGPGVTAEVVDLEWSQAANDAIVYLRNNGENTVHCWPFTGWRAGTRPALPPWAE